MPVKVGNSYVTEVALAYAQSKVSEETNSTKSNKSNNKANNMLGELSQQFKDVKFGVGTQPFSGSGTNNISIAPNILRQMADDPEKRLEYEALIYDCSQGLKEFGNRPDLKAQGYIIGSDGGLRMWAISGGDDDGKQNRSLLNVDKDKLAGRLPKKKKSPLKELQEKQLEKSKKAEEEESTKKGKSTVTFNESKRARQLSAAKTKKDIEQLMELLKTDLEDCENGLREGACDEEEVKKVKKMMERAQKKMNEVSDEDDDTFGHSPIDILI